MADPWLDTLTDDGPVSWWRRELGGRPRRARRSPARSMSDVAIVGGGYTGLWGRT